MPRLCNFATLLYCRSLRANAMADANFRPKPTTAHSRFPRFGIIFHPDIPNFVTKFFVNLFQFRNEIFSNMYLKTSVLHLFQPILEFSCSLRLQSGGETKETKARVKSGDLARR